MRPSKEFFAMEIVSGLMPIKIFIERNVHFYYTFSIFVYRKRFQYHRFYEFLIPQTVSEIIFSNAIFWNGRCDNFLIFDDEAKKILLRI